MQFLELNSLGSSSPLSVHFSELPESNEVVVCQSLSRAAHKGKAKTSSSSSQDVMNRVGCAQQQNTRPPPRPRGRIMKGENLQSKSRIVSVCTVAPTAGEALDSA